MWEIVLLQKSVYFVFPIYEIGKRAAEIIFQLSEFENKKSPEVTAKTKIFLVVFAGSKYLSFCFIKVSIPGV